MSSKPALAVELKTLLLGLFAYINMSSDWSQVQMTSQFEKQTFLENQKKWRQQEDYSSFLLPFVLCGEGTSGDNEEAFH